MTEISLCYMEVERPILGGLESATEAMHEIFSNFVRLAYWKEVPF